MIVLNKAQMIGLADVLSTTKREVGSVEIHELNGGNSDTLTITMYGYAGQNGGCGEYINGYAMIGRVQMNMHGEAKDITPRRSEA